MRYISATLQVEDDDVPSANGPRKNIKTGWINLTSQTAVFLPDDPETALSYLRHLANAIEDQQRLIIEAAQHYLAGN